MLGFVIHWMTTRYTLSKWMTTRYTFGHQPHALLSPPDLATKHRSCRLHDRYRTGRSVWRLSVSVKTLASDHRCPHTLSLRAEEVCGYARVHENYPLNRTPRGTRGNHAANTSPLDDDPLHFIQMDDDPLHF